MKEGLFKKFLSFSFGNWVGLVLGFGMTMVSTRILMPEDFGKASMFTLALNILMVTLIFGTDQSFIRFFYEEEEEKRGALLAKSLRLPMLLAVGGSGLLLIFHERVALFLFEEENFLGVFMLVVALFAQLGDRFARIVIRMHQKGTAYSLLEIFFKVVSFGSLLGLFYLLGPSYEIIIFSTVLSIVVVFLMALWIERDFWHPRRLFRMKSKFTFQELSRFGFPFMITGLITWLFESFDKVAIRNWSTLEELGLYAAAFKIVALVHVVQITFGNFWTPVAYAHFKEHPKEVSFYRKIMGIISLGMFTIGVFSIGLKDVIVFFLGQEYRSAAGIMPFLIFMPIFHTISETTVMGINFQKKPKWHIVIVSIACVVNIVGNALLVPSMGAIGASVSTAGAYFVFFILRTEISRRFYPVKFSLGKFYLAAGLITAYAGASVLFLNTMENLLGGLLVQGVLLLLYKQEVGTGVETIKGLLKKRTKA